MNILNEVENNILILENYLEHMEEISLEPRELKNNDEKKTYNLEDTINFIRNFKSKKYYLEQIEERNEKEEKEYQELLEIEEHILSKSDLIKKLYTTIVIAEVREGRIKFKSSSTGLLNFLFKNEKKNEKDKLEDNKKELLYKTLLMNLCSIVENTYSDMLKNFYNTIDRSSEFDKKEFTIEQLKKINSYNSILSFEELMSEVKGILVDKKVEGYFYNSFDNWSDEIDKVLRLKTLPKNIYQESKSSLNEMFLVRNIYVHNNGIINDRFLSKTIKYKNLIKGEKFLLDKEFIEECIQHIKNFLFGKIFSYYYEKDRKNREDNFNDFNSLMIKYLDSDLIIINHLYRFITFESKLKDNSKNISFINNCIWGYHNSDEKILEELKKSKIEEEGEVFKMAKQIILNLDSNKTFEIVERHINNISEDTFFSMHDWPLIKLARKNEKINELISGKIRSMLNL